MKNHRSKIFALYSLVTDAENGDYSKTTLRYKVRLGTEDLLTSGSSSLKVMA